MTPVGDETMADLVSLQEWRAQRIGSDVFADPLHVSWTIEGTRFPPSARTIARRAGLSLADVELVPWQIAAPAGSTPAELALVNEKIYAGHPVEVLVAEGVDRGGVVKRRTGGFSRQHLNYLTERWEPSLSRRVGRIYTNPPRRDLQALIALLTTSEAGRRRRSARTAQG